MNLINRQRIAGTRRTYSRLRPNRYELEAREKAERDYRWMMKGARREGLEKGMKEGLEKGIEKGKAEDRALTKQIFNLYTKEQKTVEEKAHILDVLMKEVIDFVS